MHQMRFMFSKTEEQVAQEKLEKKNEVATSVYDFEDIEDNKAKMKTVTDTKYLGETISDNSSNQKNIEERVKRGINAGKIIIQILEENMFGKYETSHLDYLPHKDSAFFLSESIVGF